MLFGLVFTTSLLIHEHALSILLFPETIEHLSIAVMWALTMVLFLKDLWLWIRCRVDEKLELMDAMEKGQFRDEDDEEDLEEEDDEEQKKNAGKWWKKGWQGRPLITIECEEEMEE
jgi:hypothetical protein